MTWEGAFLSVAAEAKPFETRNYRYRLRRAEGKLGER